MIKFIELIENSKIQKKEELISCLNEYHFSYSSLKELVELLEGFQKYKSINVVEYIKKIEFKNNLNKKEKGKAILEKFRREKYPFKYEVLDRINQKVENLKKLGINIQYPQNLEGDSIKLDLDINSKNSFKEKIKKLQGNADEIGEIIEIVKRGY